MRQWIENLISDIKNRSYINSDGKLCIDGYIIQIILLANGKFLKITKDTRYYPTPTHYLLEGNEDVYITEAINNRTDSSLGKIFKASECCASIISIYDVDANKYSN